MIVPVMSTKFPITERNDNAMNGAQCTMQTSYLLMHIKAKRFGWLGYCHTIMVVETASVWIKYTLG